MRYAAVVTKEGKYVLAEFPDCPGCQTFAEPGQDLAEMAQEALEGWLEAQLDAGRAPPRPRPEKRFRASKRDSLLVVDVPAKLAVKIQIRWARQAAGLTQTEFAKAIGVSQQQVALLESPDSNPTISTLERVADALDVKLTIDFEEKQARA